MEQRRARPQRGRVQAPVKTEEQARGRKEAEESGGTWEESREERERWKKERHVIIEARLKKYRKEQEEKERTRSSPHLCI